MIPTVSGPATSPLLRRRHRLTLPSERHTKAEREHRLTLVFPRRRVDAIIDSYGTDRQIITHPSADCRAEIRKGSIACSPGIEKRRSDQVPKDRHVILTVEDRASQAADRMILGVFGAKLRFVEAPYRGRSAIKKAFIDRNVRSSLHCADISKPCSESQQTLAEADVGGISSRKTGKTCAAVETLAKGSRSIENPSLVRIGRTVAKIEGLCESDRYQLIVGGTHKDFGFDNYRIDARLFGFKKYPRLNPFSERFRKGYSSVVFLNRISDKVF